MIEIKKFQIYSLSQIKTKLENLCNRWAILIDPLVLVSESVMILPTFDSFKFAI